VVDSNGRSERSPADFGTLKIVLMQITFDVMYQNVQFRE